MPDKINLSTLYHDNETQWLARFIIGMMEDPKKNWPRAINPDGGFDDQAEAEICLTIDGVEVPLLAALEGWSESYDKQVAEAVKERMEAGIAKHVYALEMATQAFTDGLTIYTKGCPFWLVSKANAESTLDDILIETSIVGLCEQVRGGFNEDDILAVFSLDGEERAQEYAERVLAEAKAGAKVE